MGMLVDGSWQEDPPNDDDGEFKRQKQAFRSWITPDGSAGPSGTGGFAAEEDRYHLYVSWACPWAHRTLIMRALKGLDRLIPVSVVHWFMGDEGWNFEPGEGVVPDPLYDVSRLYELYQTADPSFTGRVTVPVLWDKANDTIVNNESAEIIRMFNSAFDRLGAKTGDYYPVASRGEIDAVNDRVYNTVNNGVYKAGFARIQKAYERAVYPLFDTLGWLEQRLGESRYLTGEQMTEADVRLFTTLVRFDSVYHGHFKCNLKRIVDYPNLWAYTRDLFQQPEVRPTVNFDHIKKHYYSSHASVNPTRIVPAGPLLDFETPHGRSVT